MKDAKAKIAGASTYGLLTSNRAEIQPAPIECGEMVPKQYSTASPVVSGWLEWNNEMITS